jgi:peptide maturation system protein (TIGR04066 family)
MTKVAFFPTSAETLPIIKYINDYSSDYYLTALLALPGTALCGKDVGCADNRGNVGLVVSSVEDDTAGLWDVLLVTGHTEVDGGNIVREQTLAEINKTLRMSKDVVCDAVLPVKEQEHFSELARERRCSFTYLPKPYAESLKTFTPRLYSPLPFVVFIGGIIKATNTFEIFLSIVGEIRKSHNLNVLPLSTGLDCGFCGVSNLGFILHSKEYAEAEKVYAVNDFIKTQCEKHLPDVIIVHINEPILEYNERVTNDFGIYPYLLSKAISPDYFICGFPYEFGNSSYISTLSEGISGKLDFGIDFAHLSNGKIVPPSAPDALENSVVYNLYSIVEQQIEKYCADSEIPIENLLNRNTIRELTSSLIAAINENNAVISIG